MEEESWASPAVPNPPDGVKMVSGGNGYAGRGGRANADRATWESVGWEWPPQLVARVLQGSGSQLVAGASKMPQRGQLLSREGGGRSGLGRHS